MCSSDLFQSDAIAGGMGSVLAGMLLPSGDLAAGVSQGGEQHLVRKRIPEPFVNAVDKAVWHGLSGCDTTPVDGRAWIAGQESGPRKLRAIVADDGGRATTSCDDRVQLPEPMARQSQLLINAAGLVPCLRQITAIAIPRVCSVKIPMICPCANRNCCSVRLLM